MKTRTLVLLAALTSVTACEGERAGNSLSASGPVEVPVALSRVAGFDDEGAPILRAISDSVGSGPVAFLRGDSLFADVRPLLAALDSAARVEQGNGRLLLNGADTGLPWEPRDRRGYAPVLPLAARLHAYVRLDRTARMATVWAAPLLCRYARNANYAAPVFIEAAEQGLLQRCDPPVESEVRRINTARDDEMWAAAATLTYPMTAAGAAALLEAFGVDAYAVYGGIAGYPILVREPDYRTSPTLLERFESETVATLERMICELPTAVERTARRAAPRTSSEPGRPTVIVEGFEGMDSVADAFRKKRLLASAVTARAALAAVRAGAPTVYGIEVLAPAKDVKRLDSSTRVRLEPGIRVGNDWVTNTPAVTLSSGGVPQDIERLEGAALDTRLQQEVDRSSSECRKPR